MMVLTFRDIFKLACVNPATEGLISDSFLIYLLSFCQSSKTIDQSVMNPNLVYL